MELGLEPDLIHVICSLIVLANLEEQRKQSLSSMTRWSRKEFSQFVHIQFTDSPSRKSRE
jgi:hypothetical protein